MAGGDETKTGNRWRLDIGVAIIAFVAGVSGAAVGAWVSVRNTDTQLKSASMQSEADFLRSQRQSGYSTVVADIAAVNNKLYFMVIGLPVDANDDQLIVIYKEIAPLVERAQTDIAVVEIVGSKQAADVAGQISKTLNTPRNIFDPLVRALTVPDPKPPIDQSIDYSKEINALVEQFKAIARADLGSG